MSYFVYFDNNKQSFKFLKAEEGTTLSFNDNQFCTKKESANAIQQVLINGDDSIYTYYIIYSVNTSASYRASESNCSYSSQESASVNYRITGYVQFYIDISEYNDVDWNIIIDDGIKQYFHKVNNKLSPYITLSANSIEESDLINNVNNNDLNEVHEEKFNKELEDRLDEFDIDEEFFEEIIKAAKDYNHEELDTKEILRDIFEKEILVTTGKFKGKVALVGPTGVGKTTTIAKLAGRLALVEKKKVGLITIDTYRIGAIEQLKTYAEIMNIPFKVVITIKEMGEAIESMSDRDVILIDTTGRSSKNAMQISELRAFIEKSKPDYVNMVVSATTKNKDIKNILNGYSDLGYDSVIITKLDETTVYGSIYNIAKRSNKPISFVTVGQNVPDDIKIPEKEELTRFILGEETLC